jgi:hypothetical protein
MPEDALRQEANCARNEKMWTWKERKFGLLPPGDERAGGGYPPLNLNPHMRRKRRGK